MDIVVDFSRNDHRLKMSNINYDTALKSTLENSFLFLFFRYVPWNLHEPERGVFNFEDELDLE